MNKYKLILISGLANTFEWYDYALFGHFALIINEKFFPCYTISLSRVFLLFAIGYLMRPIGGILFGVIGDKFGRKVALSYAVLLMSIPTTIVSIMPTYDSIGVLSTVFIIIARLLQGLSMGGTLTSSIAFMIEHTESKYRGYIGSFSMSSICFGIMLCSVVIHIVQSCMSKDNFYLWGWRIPFLIGIIILLIGLYIKKYSLETPIFNESRKLGLIIKHPLSTVLLKYRSSIIISIFINSTGSIIFYLQNTYFTSYLKAIRHFSEVETNNISSVCCFIMVFITIISGWISDMFERRIIFIILNLLVIVSSTRLINTFMYGSFHEVILAQLILAIITAIYIGPEPALQAELYPDHIRSTALSLSYNLATSIFGGATPYIIETFSQRTGSMNFCTYYIISCATLSIIALCFYKNQSKH